MLYIMIVVASVHNGVSVSQQEYSSKEACETAAIVTKQAVKDVRRGFWNDTMGQILCVRK